MIRQNKQYEKMRAKLFGDTSVNLDSAGAEVEPQVSNIDTNLVGSYRLFYLLMAIVEQILASDVNNIDELLDSLTDNLDEEQAEELYDLLGKFLTYLKVPSDMIESLTDEDEELSNAEYKLLKQLLEDTIGDNDIFEFITYALHNPDLDIVDVELDDVQMDWAFYPKGADCNAQKAKTTGFEKRCFKGFKAGTAGFWLYPTDFEDETTSGVSAGNHESKGSNEKNKPEANRVWEAESLTAWRKSMAKHGRLKTKKSTAKEVGV
jgi:hypothetical protein